MAVMLRCGFDSTTSFTKRMCSTLIVFVSHTDRSPRLAGVGFEHHDLLVMSQTRTARLLYPAIVVPRKFDRLFLAISPYSPFGMAGRTGIEPVTSIFQIVAFPFVSQSDRSRRLTATGFEPVSSVVLYFSP